MPHVRPAAVAGLFYPLQRAALEAAVDAFVASPDDAFERDAATPKAAIVPHAGYVYSGAIAGRAYARLRAARGVVRRVILFGPAHRVPVNGLALPEATAFATPLGALPVDAAAVDAVADLPGVLRDDAVHAMEHSLEVQLPFLQRVFGEVSIVPFAVGTARGSDVAAVMDRLWGGPETAILVSSDLSHYLPYAAAVRRDAETARRILRLAPGLDHDEACGATPIDGLLRCAARRGLVPELLDLRNSGDTAGDRSRVVGYAAIVFTPRVLQ